MFNGALALAVRDTDVIVALEVEHPVRMVRHRPEPQSGKVQLVRVARRAGRWVASDGRVGLLQRVDATQLGLNLEREP